MAEKVSTLVIKVDLNCKNCHDKIRKVLCKFHCKIRSKTFDNKANTVTVTGVFDPECFSKCLMCKAGKVIKGIDIVQPVPEPKPPKLISEPLPPGPKDAPQKKPVPQKTEPEQKKPEPAQKKPEPERKPKPVPVLDAPKPTYGVPYPVPGYPPLCWEGYGRPQPPAQPPCYGGHGMPLPCHCGCGGYSSYPLPCHCGCGGYSSYPTPCHCGCGGNSLSPTPYPTPCHCGCGGNSTYPTPCHCGCGGNRRLLTGEYFCDENQANSCIIM